jgi:hypothetical protein
MQRVKKQAPVAVAAPAPARAVEAAPAEEATVEMLGAQTLQHLKNDVTSSAEEKASYRGGSAAILIPRRRQGGGGEQRGYGNGA